MIRESKYIIRRVIVGVLIALILSFINSCEVHAQTYSLSSKQLQARYYPNSSWYNINWNQWTTTTSDNSMYGIQMNFEPVEDNTGNYNPIGAGTYLLDFYIETNHLSDNLDSCRGITSDFRFEDRTTGNWVSASSSSSSSCLDSYYTTLGGNKAIHYLFQWQISDTQSYPYDASEVQFLIYNFNGSGFTIYNASYFMIMGSLQDYDPQVVSNFKKIANDNANNQALLNGINSSTQNIINNENQVKQDIINNQNQLNQNIINNNNQNTSSIIDNQNQNKQDIIDNQNANTDKEIESQQVCKYIDKANIEIDKSYLFDNGAIGSNNGFGITSYIDIIGSNVEVLTTRLGGASLCFYSTNKDLISCISGNNLNLGELSIPNNAQYFRASINKSENKPTFNVCKNGNQAMNDSINETNDTLKDNTIDDPSGEFEDFKGMLAENGVITELITLPISLFTNILNSINGTCSQFVLGELMGTNLTIPCINISEYLGSFLWNVIDILFSGIFVYTISKKMIQVFENMTSMRESDDLA